MSASPSAPRRTAWLTAAAVVGVVVSLAAGAFELDRALAGNPLSWVYTVEWPLIGGYLVYVRHRLVRDASHPHRRATPGPRSPADRLTGTSAGPVTEDDADLAAWQDYLARLRASSPPGGPPSSPSARGDVR